MKILNKHKPFKEWFAQKISALILIPSSIWLSYFFLKLINTLKYDNYEKFIAIISNPSNIIGLSIFIYLGLFHGYLGMKIICEDYLSDINCRCRTIYILKIFVISIAILFGIAIIQFYIKNLI